MHESKLTEQIIQIILTELKNHDGGKPKSVRMRVGEKYHFLPDAVQLHYQVLTKGTPLEDVGLHLVEEKMSLYCLECSQTGDVNDQHVIACPTCYSTAVKITAGEQIILEAIEMET